MDITETLPAQKFCHAPLTTFDYLEQRALDNPAHLALHISGNSLTYQQLYQDVMRVTRALESLVSQAETPVVAVGHMHPQLHLLLLLACENLGVVTFSFQGAESFQMANLPSKIDLILLDEPYALPETLTTKTLLLDIQWFKQTMTIPLDQAMLCPRVRCQLDSPHRLTQSSGTTANPKTMLLNRRQFEYMVQSQILNGAYTPQSVFLSIASFGVMGIYSRVTTCLRLGATVALGRAVDILQAVEVTHLWSVPIMLKNLLKELPQNWRKPAKLRIATGGGPLNHALRELALERLCTHISNGYGANEVGRIASMDNHGIGVVSAGVELRIVDENFRNVPEGEVGRIVVRSQGMINCYCCTDEHSQTFFKDGWFIPGDIGRLTGPRRLQLLGRGDDILNLGGIKQSAQLVEDHCMEHTQVKDAGVVAIQQADGNEVLMVALVTDDAQAWSEITSEVSPGLLQKWGHLFQQLRLLQFSKIPRTSTGKVKRNELRNILQRELTK